MAVYCEPRADEEILDETGDAEHILLIGCPSCANISYGIHKELPIAKFTPTGIKAVCMKDEIDRISRLFAEKGLLVNSWLPNLPTGMCMLDEKARRKLPNICQEIDTIVTLCCETGRKNVEDIVKGKKVIGGMSAKGLLSAVTKRKMVKIFIDKDTISIKRFSFV
jgi:hypothetical protein